MTDNKEPLDEDDGLEEFDLMEDQEFGDEGSSSFKTNRFYSKKKTWIWIGGVAILVILGVWFLRDSSPKESELLETATTNTPPPEEAPSPPSTSTAQEPAQPEMDMAAITDNNTQTETPASGVTLPDQDTQALGQTISGLKQTLLSAMEEPESTEPGAKAKETQSLQEALTVFSVRMQKQSEQIQKLEDTMADVAHNLSRLAHHMNGLDDRVSGVVKKTSDLSNEYESVHKIIQSEDLDINANIAPKAATSALTYTGPEYVVHAVIPGRAWLKSGNGEIITVSEGDMLKDYGKILIIDAANGVVMTSSGVAFR